jgi:ABC-type sugar transport system ATPase subunit
MVLDLIKRLSSQGIAVLFISHNLSDVFEVSDRLAVLRLGRMAEQGALSDYDTQTVVQLITTGTVGSTGDAVAGSTHRAPSGKG